MDTDVRKTPSYLKGLAETRARAAGDVAHYELILADVAAKLDEAKASVVACDHLIKKFDPRLDPGKIEAIRGWKGRYKTRGALRAEIIAYLKASAPEAVSTDELSWKLELQFGLDFETPQARTRWRHNSLLPALKKLVTQNSVERLHDAFHGANQAGHWRWIPEANQTLSGLAALAQRKNVGVSTAAREHEPAEDEELEMADLPR